LIVAVASAAGIVNLMRAEASGKAMAAVAANIAFRTCTQEQRAALKSGLAGYSAPSTPVRVISVSGDRESTSFGGELADAIKAAGWPTTEENLPFTRATYGLEIHFEGMVENPVESMESDVTNCPLCHSLAKALEHAEYRAKVFMWPRLNVGMPPDPTIELIVGYKPPEKP
jgi:hypothetical protein